MLSYLWIGANDVDASLVFYDSILLPLRYEKDYSEEVGSYSLPNTVDKLNGPGTVHVGKPFDGKPATAGNGMMPAFRAESRAQVDTLYAAGLAHGGEDEGAPGTRAAYTPSFYVAYLRDPAGNKIAVFFND
ncbi:Glyoxalase/bleomycin resistance protein/dioxygenase [Pseudomonas cichorii]|uniref:Glyoxalase/bleomycin resistance protein/dioxygenase n=1 Tax=Pseudomonas cichorii TaxID=36746 RepID=A0A3M4M9D4_PSECI|nr:VOC family protein [Pseudomonas cichorii]RMQ50410.1 Glyoxalase/bleomycin resistance protein/dioxygenase [Pseudomonas cichorii]